MSDWKGRYCRGNDGQIMSLALQKWCNEEFHSPALGLLMRAQPPLMAVTSVSWLVVAHSFS
jgi:hypothetical protein